MITGSFLFRRTGLGSSTPPSCCRLRCFWSLSEQAENWRAAVTPFSSRSPVYSPWSVISRHGARGGQGQALAVLIDGWGTSAHNYIYLRMCLERVLSQPSRAGQGGQAGLGRTEPYPHTRTHTLTRPHAHTHQHSSWEQCWPE